VLDEQDRHAETLAQLCDERLSARFSCVFIPAAGSSRSEHLRRRGQRARDLEPPLVAVGEVLRLLVAPCSSRRAPAARSRVSVDARSSPTEAGRAQDRSGERPVRATVLATRTLSSTLRSPKSRMFWNVRATPAAAI
jgi:hypothetical protein